jgi:hypothetical protein
MIRFDRTVVTTGLVLALVVNGAEGRRVKPVPAQTGSVETITTTAVVPLAALKSAWTQYGPTGVLEARAVVEGEHCPRLALDLRLVVMTPRAARDANFLTVCAAEIAAGTKQAALVFPDLEHVPAFAEGGIRNDLIPLPIPVADPQRIVVLGDTGCRIKGTALQDCSDPDKWPFARIAAEAAKLKPDLVIHVGDYLYRENACPPTFAGCQGTPFGDNWPTWEADFFAPAKPLLGAAPWVIVRGNHEDCSRVGAGFLRLLGPSAFDPKAACVDHLPQYSIPFAALNLVVGDNADAPETAVVDKAVPVYRAEIADLASEKTPTWWIIHRPVWGLISGPLNIPIGGNQTLIAAIGTSGIPAPVELMLSGHIHTFEAINYASESHVPPQLIAGFGGDLLDETPEALRGAIFQGSSGVKVKDGISIGGFGFVLMTRVEAGWRLDVYDRHGAITRVCQFRNNRIDCPRAKR